jgi:membrane-associated phospholipid phosphatase
MKDLPMRRILFLVPLLALAQPAQADTVTTIGTGVAIALPLTAAGIAISKRDWVGLEDLGFATFLTVGTAFALKQVVRERRPDGSDFESFPSDTTALAASGSSFLWARYGWKYGVPAFAASQFVSWSRVNADKHHWHDTAASSLIAIAYSALITPRFRQYRVYSSFEAAPGGGAVRMAYQF